jgi:4-carboxymuconolactone decarboxylase
MAPPAESSNQSINEGRNAFWRQGMENRTAVVGADHVHRSLSAATPFSMPMQEYATEAAWGWIWSRPGLERKQRSLINLAMLGVMGKSVELGFHVRGAVRNGLTEIEIREVLLQVACYAGMPTGIEAFRVAERVLSEMEEKGELPDGYRQKELDNKPGESGVGAAGAA